MSSNDRRNVSKGNDGVAHGAGSPSRTGNASPVGKVPQAVAANEQQFGFGTGNNFGGTYPAMAPYGGWHLPPQSQLMSDSAGMAPFGPFAYQQIYVPPFMQQVSRQAAQPDAAPTVAASSNKTVPSKKNVRTISLSTNETAVGAQPTAQGTAISQPSTAPTFGIKILSPGAGAKGNASRKVGTGSKPKTKPAPSTSILQPCTAPTFGIKILSQGAGAKGNASRKIGTDSKPTTKPAPSTPATESKRESGELQIQNAVSDNLLDPTESTMKQKATASPEGAGPPKKAKLALDGTGNVNGSSVVPKTASQDATTTLTESSFDMAAVANTGRWNKKERIRFDEAVKRHGQDWKKIAAHVGTRNLRQCKRHAGMVGKPDTAGCNEGIWSPDEHDRFLEAYRTYGRAWSKLTKAVQTRSHEQVRSHTIYYERKLNNDESSAPKQLSQKAAAATAAHYVAGVRERVAAVFNPPHPPRENPSAVARPPAAPSRASESLPQVPLVQQEAMAPLPPASSSPNSPVLLQDPQHNQHNRVHDVSDLNLRWRRRRGRQLWLVAYLGALMAVFGAWYWTRHGAMLREAVPVATFAPVSVDDEHENAPVATTTSVAVGDDNNHAPVHTVTSSMPVDNDEHAPVDTVMPGPVDEPVTLKEQPLPAVALPESSAEMMAGDL